MQYALFQIWTILLASNNIRKMLNCLNKHLILQSTRTEGMFQFKAPLTIHFSFTIYHRNLDQVINNLVKSFTEGTEYFKILIDVFSPEFRSTKNIHLKNFYIILPALVSRFGLIHLFLKYYFKKKNIQVYYFLCQSLNFVNI